MPFLKPSCLRIVAITIPILISFSIYGNGSGIAGFAADTVIRMHGHIYDTISDHPDRIPLKAKMVLESLPHASEIGIITSNDSTGYYEYYVNLKHHYRINIRCENYKRLFENLEPRKALLNGEIARDYYLEPEIKENQVIRLNKLIFEQGKSAITPQSYQELNKLARLMNNHPSMQIQLEGHTDYRGSKRLNMELSQQRVEAVKNYLVGKGISSRKIKTKAFGGTKPLVKEKSIEASEINRRVEVRILKIDKEN
ncbi:MAG: OmpA family protein [Cytophagales bacterium]|nr:OmpA family protein [Cytophagales bacterium]